MSVRILIADDKASSREFVRTVLEHLGYAVEEVEDGLKALEVIRARTPHLVVLDLQMPGLTGQEVATELRRESRFGKLPIIALTASAMAGDREKALASGFTSYLTKPVSVSTLRNEIVKILGSQ